MIVYNRRKSIHIIRLYVCVFYIMYVAHNKHCTRHSMCDGRDATIDGGGGGGALWLFYLGTIRLRKCAQYFSIHTVALDSCVRHMIYSVYYEKIYKKRSN